MMGSDSARSGYHHGDLRTTLILAALEMLEAGEAFSLRAVARRAGVSTAAPYRHFADREALESALAAHGLRQLMGELAEGQGFPGHDPAALATAGWSLAHGLAFLHLDGKLPGADPTAVDERVRSVIAAVFPPVS